MDEGDREWTEQQEGDREWTEPPLCVPTLAAAARAKSVHRYGAWEAATAACCPAWALVGADVLQVVLVDVPTVVLLQGADVLQVVLPARGRPALLLALSGSVRLESVPLAQGRVVQRSELVPSGQVANRAMRCQPR